MKTTYPGRLNDPPTPSASFMLEVEDWRDERERKESRMTQTQTQNDHNRCVNDGEEEANTSGNSS